MNNTPSVAVVILNWNGIYYLSRFLSSVYNTSYPCIEFIVGDNASTDGSVDYIRENFPKVRIIQNDKNYGFAEGYNRVLKQVQADYFVLLNSDVEVTTDWVAPIVTAMEKDPKVAAAQPKILSYLQPSEFEHAGAAGGFIDKYGFPFCRGRIFDHLEEDKGQYNQQKEIFWATGAAFFIKRKAWEESGGFDGDFFAHMEEIDLCWRLKRMGYSIQYYPFSEVYHVGGGALDKENSFKTFLNFRNNLFLLHKNLPFPRVFIVIFIRLWLDLVALLHFYAKGKFKDAFAVHRAHWEYFKNFRKTQKKRQNQPEKPLVSYVYQNSIVWDYFWKGRRSFQELKDKDFRK